MSDTKTNILCALKGVVIALSVSVAAVLLFALVLRLFSINLAVVKPVGYLIKTIAVFTGVFFSVKGGGGLLKGIVYGFLITAFQFLFFSLIGGGFTFSINLLWEILLGAAVGAIAGIFAVNGKK